MTPSLCPLRRRVRYPNIAVVRFPGVTGEVLDAADSLRNQRSIADLPALVVAWLGFVWGTAAAATRSSWGWASERRPGRVAFGLVDVELTPGLASASSCPEAIWQSAKWWQDFYTQAARRAEGSAPPGDTSPWGRYRARDPGELRRSQGPETSRRSQSDPTPEA